MGVSVLPFVWTAAILVASRLISNWLKLRHVPGPLLAAISDLWRAFHQCRGTLRATLENLHEEYGPVVRYGVTSVSIGDPKAVTTIYESRSGFVTVRFHACCITEYGAQDYAALSSGVTYSRRIPIESLSAFTMAKKYQACSAQQTKPGILRSANPSRPPLRLPVSWITRSLSTRVLMNFSRSWRTSRPLILRAGCCSIPWMSPVECCSANRLVSLSQNLMRGEQYRLSVIDSFIGGIGPRFPHSKDLSSGIHGR